MNQQIQIDAVLYALQQVKMAYHIKTLRLKDMYIIWNEGSREIGNVPVMYSPTISYPTLCWSYFSSYTDYKIARFFEDRYSEYIAKEMEK